ncbi:MAG TPA: hypothetical protein VMV83_01840 [Rectinemataceae bacterium]|nr:hypothetical protein [Rectinemataceae bacterium]
MPKTLAKVGLGVSALILAMSCASSPPVASKPEAAPKAPVLKERTVTIRIPILVKETVFYPDGLVDTYTAYKYNDALTRLLEKTTIDPTRPEPIERTVSEYDATGLLSDELNYGSDGSLRSRRDMTWTAGKLLASETGQDAKGAGQYSSSYAYDGSGNRISWKAFDGSGALRVTTSYTYDAQKRPVLIEMRNSADALTGSIKISYAADGSTETWAYLGSDGSLQKTEVSILKNGKVMRFEVRHPDNSLAEATDYTYGPDGERLTSVLSDANGKIKEKRSFEYLIRQDQKVETYYE